METESLFFDFMDELYREKLIVGDKSITDADIRTFFAAKQRASEKVANWTDATITRLQKTYKIYLSESGLTKRGMGDREIIKPLLTDELLNLLTSTNKQQIYKILSGTR